MTGIQDKPAPHNTNAVLFDLYGTLVHSPPTRDYTEMAEQIAEILGQPMDSFFARWMSINPRRLSGADGSSEGDIRRIGEMCGVALSPDQLLECVEVRKTYVRRWMTPKPGACETLQELKNLGFGLALVTDCTFDTRELWAANPMCELISSTVFSCELGTRKPDRRMYETALAALGVDARDAIFIGDGGSNELDGAERLGIRACMLDDRAHFGTVDSLRVDVAEWCGPRINNLSSVVEVARKHFG